MHEMRMRIDRERIPPAKLELLSRVRGEDGRCSMTLRVTMEVRVAAGTDVQGLKEKIAMDFEKYGGMRVVKVERVGGAEQYEQQRIE